MKEVKQFWVKEQMKVNCVQEEVWFEYRGPQADTRKLCKELMKFVRQNYAFIHRLCVDVFPSANNILYFSV